MSMMTIQANGRNYLFSPDDAPPRATRYWLLLRARLLNDVTLRPVTEDVRIESDLEGAIPRIVDDGAIGLVAVPKDVFPVLAGRSFTVNVTVHARGFLSQTVSVVIPTNQKLTVNPFPQAGERVMTLNDTVNLRVGEMLMINPVVPGNSYEEVYLTALGPGPNQVTIRPALRANHNLAAEPVIPVVSENFRPVDAGDILMVPQP